MKQKQPNRQKHGKYGQSAGTSIYFLLWAAFSAFALVIVLLFGVSQNLLLRQSYKDEISNNLAVSGKAIQTDLIAYHGTDYSLFVRYQSRRYDLNVYLLNGDGSVLFPAEDDFSNDPEMPQNPDFTHRINRLLSKLDARDGRPVLYEDEEEGEYVYGARMVTMDGTDVYLYVFKPLQLSEGIISQMNVRTLLMAVFVLVLSFTVSSALSGWLTRPIREMTEKAKSLARGDFSVDFQGSAYGSEMDLLADTLNFARDEISKADRMQKELIANISHDFKTPLTMIKAYASMIQEISGNNPEKRNKHTGVIIDEADRLASLVNDVLDLSKISSGIDSLKPQIFDISEYTDAVLDRFEYLEETDGYVFGADIDRELYTQADPVKIGQVLYNLIGNAVNYTGADKRIFVSVKKQPDGTARFSVSDTGKGIKPEEIADIWDRYYRSSQAHKRPVKGTGLGLSIVKTILEKHNFRFGVESVVGKGSTFYVIFPLRNSPAPNPSDSPSLQNPLGESSADKRR